MARTGRFQLVIATDGSLPAQAAMTTAMRFPWPDSTRACAVVAKQIPADNARVRLVAALNRRSQLARQDAARIIARRWPDAEVKVASGEAGEVIVREAGKQGADVIVMGRRGYGALRRLFTGSVSRNVVRQSRCSVFVVKRARRQIRRVVIGFDGSPHSMRAVELIARLQAPSGGRVSLFTAVETMDVPSHALMPRGTRASIAAEVRRINKERRGRAHRVLNSAAKALSGAGWKVDRIVETGVPLRQLLSIVVKKGADVAVVGARGAAGVRHLLLGSVADGMLDQCPVPVLIVR